MVEPLYPAAVCDIVKEHCALAGIEGDFSARSLRSGFVTGAGRQNVPLGDTMAMSGHASVTTALRQYGAGNVSVSRAARLLDRSPATAPAEVTEQPSTKGDLSSEVATLAVRA